MSIGSIIVNLNLSFYDLIDYDLIKPRAILVGSVYVFIILLHLAPPVFKYSVLHHKNSYLRRIFFIFGSTSFCSLILFWALVPEILFSPKILKEQGEWVFKTGNACFLFSLIYFLLSGFTIIFPSKKTWVKWLITAANIVAVLSVIFIISLYKDYSKMRDIVSFEFYTMLIPVTLYIIYPLMDKNKKSTFAEDVGIEIAKIKDSSDTSNFNKFLNKQKFIILSFLIMILVIFTIAHVSMYTNKIYTQLPQNLGGGKLELVKYVANGQIEKGYKIHETNSSIFIQLENKRIKKIKWDNIDEIINDY